MVLQISREQARRFLARYHFLATDLPGVFDHLGTVQYDPLNPVGRNPDLAFQATRSMIGKKQRTLIALSTMPGIRWPVSFL